MRKRANVDGVKSPGERGRIGAWAYEARANADMSVPEVVEALEKKGYAVTESTIRGVEGGSKKPGARLLRMLAQVYDTPAPGEPAPVTSSAGMDTPLVELVTLLVAEQRQTREMLERVLSALAGEHDPERERRRQWVDEQMAQAASRSPLPTPDHLETPAR